MRLAQPATQLENDRQTCRALAALTNAGLASLLPVVEEAPRRLSVRVLLNQEALEAEASFGDASERPANVELRLALALAMSVRGDASFVPYTPQRTRVAARSAMSADAVQKIFAAAAPARNAPALAAAPESLLLSLRRYQLQAVQWMCDREASVAALPDPLWEQLDDASAPGQPFLYNRCIGRVKRAQPVPLLKDIAGGILCALVKLTRTPHTHTPRTTTHTYTHTIIRTDCHAHTLLTVTLLTRRTGLTRWASARRSKSPRCSSLGPRPCRAPPRRALSRTWHACAA